jgi:iron complex outermembrane receptor protein
MAGVSAAVLGSLATAASAQAQTSQAPASAAALEEVVVTGSRVVRDGYQAPTPTTTVGAELLQQRAPATLIDALNTLPVFRGNATSGSASQVASGTLGASFVNARGLGTNRTLVLLNGQRIVPTTSTGLVDISILPSAIVKRVDVVTGGASAAYGSDAVAGVVDFVLDTDLTGLKGEVSGGISSRSDGEQFKATLSGGMKIGDRLHIMASGEYYDSHGVLNAGARPWTAHPMADVVTNTRATATNGQPKRYLVPYGYASTATFGGLINSGPLRGTEFLPGGATQQFEFCDLPTGGASNCGRVRNELTTIPLYALNATPQERTNFYSRATYNASDNLTLYADVLYGTNKSNITGAGPYSNAQGDLIIRNDNAYLPASVRTAMAAAGVTTFTLGRASNDVGIPLIQRDNKVLRFTGGFEATLGESWRLSGYAETGETKSGYLAQGLAKQSNYVLATDAVVAPGGQIVCRSTLTDPTNGCVPMNVFGVGSPSTASRAYVNGDSTSDLTFKQDSAHVEIGGEPLTLWAGPVSLVAGLDWRHQSADQTADPDSQAGRFVTGNPKALSGKVTVKEIFGEIVVPLLKDTVVQSLDLNAAGRVTDYSTSGRVETWKVGVTSAINDQITLRGTLSRDIRAPNIIELFATSLGSTGSFLNPVTGVVSSNTTSSTGNPDLQPEKADTTAGGVVYRPSWFPGLSGSIDFYRIKIADAISTLSATDIVLRCSQGNAALCALITRNPAGVVTAVSSPQLNLNQSLAQGVDLDFSYRTEISNFIEPWSGVISLRALGNYIEKQETYDGVRRVDRAGSLSNGQPIWNWNFSAAYVNGPLILSTNVVRIGGGRYNNDYIEGIDIDYNRVKPEYYTDIAAQYKMTVRGINLTYFVNIDNLFDAAPSSEFSFSGNGAYPRVGRFYKTGVRFSF